MGTPVQIPKLLLDYLEELNEEQLKGFQWQLVQSKRDGCKSIQKCQLERADREDTVDRLVQAYREDGAVETTVDILFRIKPIADRQQSCENVSSTASPEKKPKDLSFQEGLCCPVCLQVYTEPAMLQCGHSFCKTCIHNHWGEKIVRKCPLCVTVVHETDPPTNFALKSLSESYKRKRSLSDPSGGDGEDTQPCQTLPKPVKEKQDAFEEVKRFCDASIAHIKNQSQDAERKIKEDFAELHVFLQQEEKNRIAALKEEEMQKTRIIQRITEMNRDTFSLSDKLKAMEDLGADSLFVQNFRTEIERCQSALPDAQLLPRSLINVAEHVGNLQFKVWERMMSIIQHTPVILDPNTASPRLSVSADLTEVTVADTWQQRPGNPERSTSYFQVLGSEGFSSGKHCWEVEVGNHPRWILGVTEEAVGRKEELCSTPRKGLWTIMKRRSKYKDAVGKTLTLEKRPKRIRIQLDYENGAVSFHNAENDTPIYTCENTFTQKLYPYFAFTKIDEGEGRKMKIAAKMIQVEMMYRP
ncbi:zinc-binding protein A33-like [Centroberyx gerrardi]